MTYLDIPYEPPFEMPNYREVGRTLLALIRSHTIEDDLPNNEMTFTTDASENTFFEPPILPQQEIGECPQTDVSHLFNAFGPLRTEDDSPFARAKPEPKGKSQPSMASKPISTLTSQPTPRPTVQRTTSATRTIAPRVPSTVRRPTASSARPPITATRTSISQPVTRAPTSQSTVRAPISRTTTRAPSTVRSTPPVRPGATQLSRATSVSRPTIKPAARPTAPIASIKGKAAAPQPNVTPATRNPTPSNARPNAARPRSGTITKEAFESNTHVVVHIRNNSIEDVKKDLEGLIVLEDAFDEDDGFRFDV